MPFSYNKNVKREKHENAQMSRPGQKRNVDLLFYVIFQNNIKLNYENDRIARTSKGTAESALRIWWSSA